jgi:hypothetical protein
MNSNRNTMLAKKLTSVQATYVDAQIFQLKGACKQVKIAVVGGEAEISFNGGVTDEGLIKPADGIVTFDVEASSIAVRQSSATITELRLWAY